MSPRPTLGKLIDELKEEYSMIKDIRRDYRHTAYETVIAKLQLIDNQGNQTENYRKVEEFAAKARQAAAEKSTEDPSVVYQTNAESALWDAISLITK